MRGGDASANRSFRLDSLPNMSKDALFALWRQLFKTAAPERLRRYLLVRVLAYRIQEQAFGGLGQSAQKRLRQIARAVEKDPATEISAVPPFKAGTRLLRQWRDQTHIVTITGSGYEYQGSRYRSLSEIARLITGTRWSGPAFFGLKVNKTKAASTRSK
jgi:hypothetical protein